MSEELLAVVLPSIITALGLVVVKILDIKFAADRERAAKRRRHRPPPDAQSLLARLERLERERLRDAGKEPPS